MVIANVRMLNSNNFLHRMLKYFSGKMTDLPKNCYGTTVLPVIEDMLLCKPQLLSVVYLTKIQ